LNRIDETILFRALTREHLREIVDIQLQSLKKRLAERHIEIEISPAVKDKLSDEGYDPVLGARPLKRVIQRRLQNVLALKILRGEIKDGERVEVGLGPDGELVFETQATPEKEAA
jgi:ATP-dependent Clp protease ATP-binding subunit ClpB